MGDKYEVDASGLIRPVVLASDPATPPEGFFYYNTTSDTLRFYDGSQWKNIDTDSQSLQQVLSIGNAATVNIELDDAALIVTGAPTGDIGLDLSGMDNASIIKVKLYQQSGAPSLNADGEFAFWWDTDDDSLRLIARNNGTTKTVELS